MRPPFRFLYVFLAAALTYGALAVAHVPRYDGPHRGWIYGHNYGFRGHGGCGHGCGGYDEQRSDHDRSDRYHDRRDDRRDERPAEQSLPAAAPAAGE